MIKQWEESRLSHRYQVLLIVFLSHLGTGLPASWLQQPHMGITGNHYSMCVSSFVCKCLGRYQNQKPCTFLKLFLPVNLIISYCKKRPETMIWYMEKIVAYIHFHWVVYIVNFLASLFEVAIGWKKDWGVCAVLPVSERSSVDLSVSKKWFLENP